MIHNIENNKTKLKESLYNNTTFDSELYHTIVIFLNSISFSIIVTSLCDEELDPIERDKQIMSIAMCIFIICELEYMGLL